jgi:hypothetical protein
MTRKRALKILLANNVARGIAWAFNSACDQALEDFTRGTGYGALTAGVGRYELIADRLDRVFSCGDYEVAEGMESVGLDVLYDGLTERARLTMPVIPAGTVVRSNFRGSNGWSVGGFRFITHSFSPGGLGRIDWTQASKTLQAVSRQAPDDTELLTLLDVMLSIEQRNDLAAQDDLPAVVMPTVVLMHALDRDTAERELAIGHSRYNDDVGGPWHWHEDLLSRPGPGQRPRVVPDAPAPTQQEPDVTVRLRKKDAAEGEL